MLDTARMAGHADKSLIYDSFSAPGQADIVASPAGLCCCALLRRCSSFFFPFRRRQCLCDSTVRARVCVWWLNCAGSKGGHASHPFESARRRGIRLLSC